jgi:hypothetical protein
LCAIFCPKKQKIPGHPTGEAEKSTDPPDRVDFTEKTSSGHPSAPA